MTQAPATPELVERLKDASERFLKWTYDQPYSGSPVISIPRHPNNIDAILCEAAAALEAQQARIAELEGRAEFDELEAQHLADHANRLSDRYHFLFAVLMACSNDRAAGLQALADRYEKALRPFAEVARHDIGEDEADADLFKPMSARNSHAPLLKVGDLRQAALALSSQGRREGGER